MKKKNLFYKIKRYHVKLWSAKIIPHMVTNKARLFFYRLIGYKNISKKAFIGMRCYLDDLEPKMLIVEDNVTISYGVFFSCHGYKQKHHSITIKEGSYIGMRTTLLAHEENGLTIGKNAVVGACSFVNKNVPDNETWAGVPAKKIK